MPIAAIRENMRPQLLEFAANAHVLRIRPMLGKNHSVDRLERFDKLFTFDLRHKNRPLLLLEPIVIVYNNHELIPEFFRRLKKTHVADVGRVKSAANRNNNFLSFDHAGIINLMWPKIKGFLFHNLSTRQTVAKNTFWLAVSNVGGRLLRAIVIIYAARILGASEWGIFSYAISLVTFLTIFTDVGISPILVREASKLRDKPEERSGLLSTSFVLKSVFLAVGILVIILVTPQLGINEAVKVILPIAILILIFDALRELGFSFVRAMEKMEWEAALYLATNTAIVAFGFIFLKTAPTVSSFAYAYALGTGLGMTATIFVLRKYLSGILTKFSFRTAKQILASGWPFAISAVLAVLLVDTDILIVGWLRSTTEVGLLSAAQRIVQLFYILPGVLSVSLLPSFARLAGKDNEKLRVVANKALSFIYALAVPLAFGGVILGKEIILFIFGGDYIGGSLAFQLLIATIIINFPTAVLTNLTFAFNKQRQLTIYAAIGGISNVLLDFLLIPRFGISGSAAGTLLVQILSTAYLWGIVLKLLPISIAPHLKKIFIASLAMAGVVLLAKLTSAHLLVSIAAGIGVYFLVLAALKEPLLSEIRSIILPGSTEAHRFQQR